MAEEPAQSKVIIEMWADVGCPWCYVAKHRLRNAIAQRSESERFEIVVRSFELNPDTPREPESNEAAYLRSHSDGSAADLLRGELLMQQFARAEGIGYVTDRLSANTLDVHRIVQYANEHSLGLAFFSAVQDGLFTGTVSPYEPGALARVAESVGLDRRRVEEILVSDEYTEQARADRDEALALGAMGVPFVVIDRRLGAQGSQKLAAYAQLLEQSVSSATSGVAS